MEIQVMYRAVRGAASTVPESDREDVVQEAMLRLLEVEIDEDRTEKEQRAFVKTITKRVAVDYLRRRSYRTRKSLVSPNPRLEDGDTPLDIAESGSNPESECAVKEFIEGIDRVVRIAIEEIKNEAAQAAIRRAFDVEGDRETRSPTRNAHCVMAHRTRGRVARIARREGFPELTEARVGVLMADAS